MSIYSEVLKCPGRSLIMHIHRDSAVYCSISAFDQIWAYVFVCVSVCIRYVTQF